jgi:hypothetical protein
MVVRLSGLLRLPPLISDLAAQDEANADVISESTSIAPAKPA